MGIFSSRDKLRILLLIDGMDIGGAETHLLTLARALVRRGAEVDVMCDTGAYVAALKTSGVHVLYAPFRDRSLRGLLGALAALTKARRNGYYAVHAHTRYTAALAALFLHRIPLITTVHLDFSISPFKRFAARWGRRSLAVSADLVDYLTREYGVKRTCIHLTKNGIDTEDFAFLPRRGSAVLHISRLDRDRSLCAHMLCAVAPALCKTDPLLVIRIYGDGDDFASVRAAADAANERIGRRAVLLMGRTDRVYDVLKDGAVLVGVSRAALEGAAAGLPIILAGNDGYGGILTEEVFENRIFDNFCCRGCKKMNENQLLADILFLLEHRCYCENLRMKISVLIHKDFSADAMAADALAAYHAAQRIALIGYYGYKNFGDEQMLRAILRALYEKGARQIGVLTNASAGFLSRKRPLRTAFRLWRCDRVLFGGGNLLQSETSARSLFYYACLLLLCRGRREGIGMGLGGFCDRRTERLAGRALSRFHSLSLRTQTDAATACRLCPSAERHIYLGCDPCLFLPERALRKGKTLLFIPRRSPDPAMLSLLKAALAEGRKVRLCILFPREDANDVYGLSKELGIEVAQICTAEDFFRAARDSALSITERLHGAVFSLLYHLPCLLYAGYEKNRAFAADCENVAKQCDVFSPVLPYLTAEDALAKMKEAEGTTLGFSEIIQFFRMR